MNTLHTMVRDCVAGQLTWLKRNWKWCIPMIVILGSLSIAIPLVLVWPMASDAYDAAFEGAHEHPVVVRELGAPVVRRGVPTGHVARYAGGIGHAHFVMQLRGSQARGKLIAKARYEDQEWAFERLTLHVDDDSFDLLDDP